MSCPSCNQGIKKAEDKEVPVTAKKESSSGVQLAEILVVATDMSSFKETQHTILVVDDNGVLRMHAAELLKDAGYRVVEAADTVAAMAILEERKDIRLLFTDVQLPAGRDGLSLARQVTDLWPDVLLLITSGGSKILDDDIPHEARFLTKPYSDRQLLGHIEAMIADRCAADQVLR